MKAKVEGSILAAAAALAESVSDEKSSVEVLGFVRVEFSPGAIAFRATDTEQRVTASIAADVSESGVALVPAKKLKEVSERLARGPITLTKTGEALVVRGSGSRFSLPCAFDPKEFPEFMEIEGLKEYRVNAETFLAALRACAGFVAGAQDSRHVLKGVHVIFGDGAIRMEATDGHRMTTLRAPVEGEVPAADVVIPPNLFRPAGLLLKTGQPVTVAIAEREVGFYTDSVRLFGRLIEGKYVAFAEHLARILKAPRQAVVDVGLLTEAVQRVQIVTEHIPAHPVKLRFDPETKVLLVTDEAGHADTEIENVFWDDAPFTIMLKSDYLLDFLALLPSTGQVTLRLADDLSPMGLVSPDGGPQGAILPLRPHKTVDPVAEPPAPAA